MTESSHNQMEGCLLKTCEVLVTFEHDVDAALDRVNYALERVEPCTAYWESRLHQFGQDQEDVESDLRDMSEDLEVVSHLRNTVVETSTTTISRFLRNTLDALHQIGAVLQPHREENQESTSEGQMQEAHLGDLEALAAAAEIADAEPIPGLANLLTLVERVVTHALEGSVPQELPQPEDDQMDEDPTRRMLQSLQVIKRDLSAIYYVRSILQAEKNAVRDIISADEECELRSQ